MSTWASVVHNGDDHLLSLKEFLDKLNLLYIWICLYLQQINSYKHVS
jgi:hypothetical protein